MGLGNFRKTAPPPLRERAICALIAAVALAFFPAQAGAQAVSDSASADARAVVLEQGTLWKVTDLDFGEIAKPNTSGTVTMTAAAAPTCTPSGGLIRSGPCVAAQFALLGRKNWLIRLRRMSPTPIILNGPGGATMTMNMTHSVSDAVLAPGGPSPPGSLGRYRINSENGFAHIYVGGTLNVGATQATGLYEGTIEIQVLFN